MDPIQAIITEALTGTTDTDTAMCRVSCNAVASQQMFCSCGKCLDQTTTVVATVKTPKRRVVLGYCQTCWDNMANKVIEVANQTDNPILVEGWDGVIFQKGEV